MLIPNFSLYKFTNDKVIRISDSKEMMPFLHSKIYERYKLKNDQGNWKTIAKSNIYKAVGKILQLPLTAKPIPNTENYFADIDGSIYSFSSMYPTGKILKNTIGSSGYPRVNIYYSDSMKAKDVHQLMAITFLMEDYVEKGLCCMHLDDDKTNPKLSNLAIGTYSQNNKDAYSRGLNPGNGLKKIQ